MRDVPYQIEYTQHPGAVGTEDPQLSSQQPGGLCQSGGSENLFASKYITVLLFAIVILTFFCCCAFLSVTIRARCCTSLIKEILVL